MAENAVADGRQHDKEDEYPYKDLLPRAFFLSPAAALFPRRAGSGGAGAAFLIRQRSLFSRPVLSGTAASALPFRTGTGPLFRAVPGAGTFGIVLFTHIVIGSFP